MCRQSNDRKALIIQVILGHVIVVMSMIVINDHHSEFQPWYFSVNIIWLVIFLTHDIPCISRTTYITMDIPMPMPMHTHTHTYTHTHTWKIQRHIKWNAPKISLTTLNTNCRFPIVYWATDISVSRLKDWQIASLGLMVKYQCTAIEHLT